jgi:hypothetical protein
MRRAYGSVLAVAAIIVMPRVGVAQGDESSRAVAGGGITAPGWMGKVDAAEEAKGLALKDQKLSKMGDMLMVTTGPATTYWNPANKASGNYTVKATFNEAKYMNLNDHPHPYGIVIGGNDMGSGKDSFLYCAAYGSGLFIVRGFGNDSTGANKVFRVGGGGRGEANAAIHKAAGPGQPVSQEIAVSVKGDKVECAVNGTVVGSYDKAAVVGMGKLKSTDGVYGFRFAHNTEASVVGLTMTKQ